MLARFRTTQLRRNFLANVLTTVASAALALITYPLTLHFLGYDLVGVWALVSTISSLTGLGQLGIGQAVLNAVATERARGNDDSVEAHTLTGIAIVTVMGLIICGVLVLARESVAGGLGLTGSARAEFLRLVPAMALLSVHSLGLQVYVAALMGAGRMDQAVVSQLASRGLVFVASVVLLWKGMGLAALVVATAIGNVALQLLTRSHLRRIVRVRLLRAGALNVAAAKHLLRFGTGVLTAQLASMLYQPLNRVCAARFAGVESVALVDLSFTASLQARALLEAGFRALSPEMSKALVESQRDLPERMRRLRARSLAIIVVLGVPVFVAGIILAPLILRVWLRGRYTERAVPVVRIMLGAAYVGLLHVPAYYMLLGLGRLGPIVGAHVVQAVANVAVIAAVVAFSGAVTPSQIAIAVLGGTASATLLLLMAERACIQSAQGIANAGAANA